MTKNYFIELASYNVWANDNVCSWLEQLTDEQWNRTITSSFNSIRETVIHTISAEKAWLDRFEKKPLEWLQGTYEGSRLEHIRLWKEVSGKLKEYVEGFDETRLTETLTYRRLNGEQMTTPFYVMFAHVFNHSTYHRGQLVTMIRQAGFSPVGSTDILIFFRK